MSVALRTITRLQDADDVNVTLGAGVDEYALCWDQDTGKFVLRAPAAPFAGILATGVTVGATAQAQVFNYGVSANATRQAVVGLIARSGAWPTPSNIQEWYDHDNGLRAYFTSAGGLRLSAAGNDGPYAGISTQGLLIGYIELGTVTGRDLYKSNSTDLSLTSSGATAVTINLSDGVGTGGFKVGNGQSATPVFSVSGAGLTSIASISATTDALRNVLTLGANVTDTGVGAAGLGNAILFQAETTAAASQDQAQIGALWTTATHATRTSKLTFATVNNAGALNTDMTIGLGGMGVGTVPVAGTRIAASIVANDASITNIYGSNNIAVANHTTGNLSSVYGMYNQAIQQGAGGVSNLAALTNTVSISANAPNTANAIADRGYAMAYTDASSVTVFNAAGWGQATGGKSLSIARGLWIAAPTAIGAVTIAYGILLDAIAGAGTNYAIYSAGGQSYHAGNFGIGNTAPAEALDVTGNINTTGVYKVDDVQVLSNRVIDARCADVANSGDATTDGLIDALRDAMVAHGLIAAA